MNEHEGEIAEADRARERPINFRPILLWAAALIGGIALCSLRSDGKLKNAFLCVAIPAALLLVAFPLCCRISSGKRERALFFDFLFAAAFVAAGFFLFSASISAVRRGEVENGWYSVCGDVVSISVKEGYKSIILDSCTVNGSKTGKISVRTKSDVRLYDSVEFTARISKAREKNAELSFYYRNAGVSSVAEGYPSVKVSGRKSSLPAKTNDFLFAVFGGNENGGVAVALLSGDLSGVNYETLENYRMTGIAHVFAVSGMHVGLLFTALSFLLGKVPGKKAVKCIVISLTLFFYSYLCGGSASSLRAAVMCSVLGISRALGEKPDSINAFGLSAIVTLFLDPFDLFTVGFMLSYAACFSLIVLAPALKRRLAFLPDSFASALSVAGAAELFTLPLMISSFGRFNFISLIVNLAVLPVVSFLYYGLWIALVLYIIFPFYRLIGVNITSFLSGGIDGVLKMAGTFSFSAAVFPDAAYVPWYLLLILWSDLVNLPEKAKKICLSLTIVFFVAIGAFFGLAG